ncbi:protein O-linked-mannose beta-1,2-N-acetylglucosaminyltransferase 1-like [Homarus americanus]|uniref:protein O-linked-mannose beta-1,2-N-acetylglucosaminyltransferase 1-like n=1 Tax=Homarus americanus TaxID=6706 RepID=UPI001C4737E6|nr:protein O-linked-mannose beta-1,2-N-acetylglucosaminyltransferase 1-like [Homarus americanus]
MGDGCIGYVLLVTVTLVTVTEGAELLSMRWRNIGRGHNYKPYNLATHNRIREAISRHLHLSVSINTTCVTLKIDDQLVYEGTGEAVNTGRYGALHSGVHVLVVHGGRGNLMMARQFLTYQPAEHARLKDCVASVQHGRVIVLVGVPEWVMFLGRGAEETLTSLGSRWAAKATQGEVWAWVGVVGGKTLAEATTTRGLERYPSSDLHLDVYVAKTDPGQVRCPWYTRPRMYRQATFCERYEGYGDLCTCNDTFFPETRRLQEFLSTQEQIPVVVVTAFKPYYLYRLLRQLFTMAGAWQTEVLVVVDGAHQETLALVEVMGVSVVIHRPEGFHNNRINANVKFALDSVFRRFAGAHKAIVLEDDLLLSPDLLRYFHQVSPLLDLDPSVYCVNAYSSNSFADTASDPQVLLRARTYPMYGWMITRAYSSEVIQKWVPPGKGDWDWWLAWEDLRKGRDVVFPEVSRTFHSGSAGVHVTGFEQEVFFNRMIYNHLPHVDLMDVNQMIRDRYDERLTRDLKVAKTLDTLPRDLCAMTWVTRNSSRPLALYLHAEDNNDKYHSFKLFLMCLRTYDESTREIYKGVIRVRWRGTLVYLVGCPFSPFCIHNPRKNMVFKPSMGDLQAAGQARDEWELTFRPNPRLARHPDLTPDLDLNNFLTRQAETTTRSSGT